MSYFQIDSTLLVFSSVTLMPPSPTASLVILVHKRSPFSEISKSQKSEHDTFCVLSRPHYRACHHRIGVHCNQCSSLIRVYRPPVCKACTAFFCVYRLDSRVNPLDSVDSSREKEPVPEPFISATTAYVLLLHIHRRFEAHRPFFYLSGEG